VTATATVLDGGLATELEAQGADLSDELWSARVLAEDPGRVVAAHAAFVAAGADVAISSSYQASFEGFARAGYDREAGRLGCAVRGRSDGRGRYRNVSWGSFECI